jgi:hypothetical protein
MEDKLSQDEIDALALSITMGENTLSVAKPGQASKIIMEKYNSLLAILERYEFALRNNEPFVEAENRRIEVHQAAHRLWLANHGLTKDSYWNLMHRHRDGWIARGCPTGRR